MAFGAVLLFSIGTNIEAGWLLVLASLLLGALLVGVVVPPFMVRGVRVERRAPAEAFQGDEVRVEAVVAGRGRRLRLSIAIDDPNLSRARMFVPVIRPGERLTVSTLRRAARRGISKSQPLTISSAAPFGVARASRTVASNGATLVYPRVVPVREIALLESSIGGAGSALAAWPGGGHEYLGVRKYRLGDHMRHVHWPSTARAGALMVKEFEREQPSRLGVVIDASTDDGKEDTPLDLCCSIAASVAVAALEQGHPITLVAAKEDGLDTLETDDRLDALEWLARLRVVPGRTAAEVVLEARLAVEAMDALLLVLPTWAANDPDEVSSGLIGAIGASRRSMPLAAALVDASAFRRTRRAPHVLPGELVEVLEAGLRAQGARVVRVAKAEELEGCLGLLLARDG